ncbi:MAG TPA: MFS transporter [Spirochaetia bacterium]|nr:MFS transporter [Spirochaetia bacterium]
MGPVALAVFLGGIGGGIAFPILPLLGVRLGLSGIFIGFILSANRITRLGMNPVSGSWIDRVGGKIPLTVGLLIEAAATGTFSLALHTTIPGWLLLLGRVVWGIGSSLLLVGGTTLALNLSNEKTRGRSTALVGMALSLGMPAGMLAGGVIAGFISDEAAFVAATIAAAAAAAMSWLLIPGAKGASQPPGVPESSTPGLTTWLRAQWLSIVRAERRIKVVWLTNLLVFFSIPGILLATLVLVVYQRRLTLPGFDVQATAGVMMAVMISSSAAGTVLVGRLIDRVSSRVLPAIPAIGAAAAGFALLGLSTRLIPAAVSLVLIGAGSGATSTPLLALLGDLTPGERRGNVVGLYQFFGDIGGSFGPIAGLELGGRFGYQPVYLGVTVIFAVIAILLVRIHAAERSLAAARADRRI